MSRGGTRLRAIVGAAISIVAIILVLRSVDLQRTGDTLAAVDPRWVAVAAGFLLADLLLRAVRWQRLLAPVRIVPYRSMLAYLLVGYLANNLLPARLGELVRSHFLGDREGLSRATALGTIVVERAIDLVVVVAIASFALLVLSVRGVVVGAVLVAAGVTGLLIAAVALGIAAHRLPGSERLIAAAAGWPRLRELGSSLQGGLAVAGRPRTLVTAVGVSLACWGAVILGFAAAGQAVGLELTIGQAGLLASGVALAAAVPAGPSNLGTFELAAVEIARAIGLPPDPAFALALIAHASILVITSAGGGIALARLGWRRAPEDLTNDEPPAVAGGSSGAMDDREVG